MPEQFKQSPLSSPPKSLFFECEEDRYQAFLSELSLMHAYLVGFGLRVLQWCSDNNAGFGEVHSAPILLLRQVVDIADGGKLVSEKGQLSSYRALQRVLMEGAWSFEYMLRENRVMRATAYQVEHTLRRIDWYKQLDPDTAIGKQFRSEVKKDKTIPDDTYTNVDLSKLRAASQNLEEMLSRQPYAKVYSEWKAVKKTTKRRPNWYSLFEGPHNLQELARRLGRDAQYTLYRLGSETTHSTNALHGIIPLKSGGAAIQPLRWPEGLDIEAANFVSQVLHTFSMAINCFCPDKKTDYQYWYLTDIRDTYIKLATTRVLKFDNVRRKTLFKET